MGILTLKVGIFCLKNSLVSVTVSNTIHHYNIENNIETHLNEM